VVFKPFIDDNAILQETWKMNLVVTAVCKKLGNALKRGRRFIRGICSILQMCLLSKKINLLLTIGQSP
jgi:hypothetical protein